MEEMSQGKSSLQSDSSVMGSSTPASTGNEELGPRTSPPSPILGIGAGKKQAGTSMDFYYSLKRQAGLLAKSLLLADKNKGKVRRKSPLNSTEKYNPLPLEFLMQKNNVNPQGGRRRGRN